MLQRPVLLISARSTLAHHLNAVARLNAALAGRYEIEREIGAGGMATVFLARDLRHARLVALKVLKPELAAVLGVDRFLAEISVTAKLQHPNLLPLFDSGETDGLFYYVMPYVEGESLRQRLDRERQLGVGEAVRLAQAVANGLDYAHRRGVIHRDLKPENILIVESQPVVADFGIALAVSNAAGERITQTGLSLGTPQYMSPEQATGDRQLDARSDIYALAAVLYEMLAGVPPHSGPTVQAVIAKVVTEEPRPVVELRKTVPDPVTMALRRALEKVPADRWSTAAEFAEALGAPSAPALASAAAYRGPGVRAGARFQRWRVGAVLTCIVAAGALGFALSEARRERSTTRASPAYFPVEAPDSVTTGGDFPAIALSMDGSQLVIRGLKNGRSALYLRRLDDPVPALVTGTDGARWPTFSSDGRWLLYTVAGSLRRSRTDGGPSQLVADSVGLGTASWGDDDHVVFVREQELWLVSVDGSGQRRLARPDTTRGITDFRFPHVLPGARAALVNIVKNGDWQLATVSLENGSVTELGVSGGHAQYVASGHVVFHRGEGLVYVAPFSPGTLQITGPAVLLLENVQFSSGNASQLAVSFAGGNLSYSRHDAGSLREMVIVDRSGSERAFGGPAESYQRPRVSPDGRRVAVGIGPLPHTGNVWVYDVATGNRSPMSSDGRGTRAVWTADGSQVAYITGGALLLMARRWDREAEPSVLLRRAELQDVSLGPAHGWSAFRIGTGAGDQDIFIAPTDSPQAMRPFVASDRASELAPRVSPDGRLLAYSSDESGRPEVYVRPLPGPGSPVQVSREGGSYPMWPPGTSTLFYRSGGRLLAATIVEQPTLAVASVDSSFRKFYGGEYDVFPGGQELIMFKPVGEARSRLFMITNWQQWFANQHGTDPVR